MDTDAARLTRQSRTFRVKYAHSRRAGAERIMLEYEHGNATPKDNLNMLLSSVQEGDTLITLEVSRVTSSTKELCEIIEVIKAKRLRLMIVGSITVDCRNGQIDLMSQAFVQMSAVFAELELSIIRARVRSGMANAKAKGNHVDRPEVTKDDIPTVFFKHYPTFAARKMNVGEFAQVCGLSKTPLYKYLKLVR